MAERGHWVHRFAEGTDLHGETLPGVPVVEIAGGSRVLIEKHGGVVEYACERIRIRVSYGMICVFGSQLELLRMTKQQVIISGQIDGIRLQREDR